VTRTLLHTRSVTFRGYRRDDGLWEIEADLRDERAYESYGGDRATIPAGSPVHDLHIRAVVDDTLTIRGISSGMAATPVAECKLSQEPLQAMVGVTMGPGWRRSIESRMGGVNGCTHLRELLFSMATAAYQTIPVYQGQLARRGLAPPPPSERPPGHLEKCLALAFDGPAVQRHYPRYYMSSDISGDREK
jgi:hypothetical protein